MFLFVLILIIRFFLVGLSLQYRRKDAGASAGKKGDKKDLNELKQELDIDDHKIPIEELYQRLGTNPETVSYLSVSNVLLLFFL